MTAKSAIFAVEASAAACLAAASASLIWTLAGPSRPLLDTQSISPARAEAPRPDMGSLLRLDAFGLNAPIAAVSIQEDAPETGLNLAVTGLRSLTDGSGAALIRLPDGSEGVFRVGDALLTGVTVAEIRPDRILILRDGALESLFAGGSDTRLRVISSVDADGAPLYVAEGGDAVPGGAGAALPSSSGAPVGASSGTGVAVRDIELSAEGLLAGLEVRPVRSGDTVTGYRLFPAGDGAAFAAAGLEPGDTLIEVDGAPASDLETLAAAFDGTSSRERLNVVIDRGGASLAFEIEFD